MDSKPTVFIIDPDPNIRESLSSMVRAVQLHAEAYESVAHFLEVFDPTRRSCVLLDFRPEDTDALSRLEQLRAGNVFLPVVIISAHGTVPFVVRAMRAGAINFLEKPCSDRQIEDALREAIGWYELHCRELSEQAQVRQAIAQLTPGERVVLEKLMRGKSNREIAAELGLSVRTIEVRRAKLMRKMAAQSLAELVRLALLAEANDGFPTTPTSGVTRLNCLNS